MSEPTSARRGTSEDVVVRKLSSGLYLFVPRGTRTHAWIEEHVIAPAWASGGFTVEGGDYALAIDQSMRRDGLRVVQVL